MTGAKDVVTLVPGATHAGAGEAPFVRTSFQNDMRTSVSLGLFMGLAGLWGWHWVEVLHA